MILPTQLPKLQRQYTYCIWHFLCSYKHHPFGKKRPSIFQYCSLISHFMLNIEILPDFFTNVILNFSQLIQIAGHQIKVADGFFYTWRTLLIFYNQTAPAKWSFKLDFIKYIQFSKFETKNSYQFRRLP